MTAIHTISKLLSNRSLKERLRSNLTFVASLLSEREALIQEVFSEKKAMTSFIRMAQLWTKLIYCMVAKDEIAL